MYMHIKICGLTNLDDALAAVDAGADYLGFNFYPKSPRLITPGACAAIAAALAQRGAPVTTVGLFVNTDPAEAAELLDLCGLNLAQLHGDEQPQNLTRLWGRAFKAVRDAHLGNLDDLAAVTVFSPGAPALLVDAYQPGMYGGTGRTANWNLARPVAERYPIFLAGGLTPANVAEAIAAVRPWGVDVASGVEASPGRKDREKMVQFVANARSGSEKSDVGGQMTMTPASLEHPPTSDL